MKKQLSIFFKFLFYGKNETYYEQQGHHKTDVILALLVIIAVVGPYLVKEYLMTEVRCISEVIDGDTVKLIVIDDKATRDIVRIANIDAPEMNYYSDEEPEEGAIEAREKAKELLEPGECYKIHYEISETTGKGTGKWHRLIGDFELKNDDRTFGEYMVEEGYAEEF